NQPNDNACIKENLDADDDVADAAFDVKENKNDVHVSANRSDKTDNKKHDEKPKRDDKGKNTVDSLTGVRDLRSKFEEFSVNSSNRVNAVSTPVYADEPNPTNSSNSFNTASPCVNDVSPNFRIAGKSSFMDPSKYPDDPDMPELEDIIYSDDEKKVGAKADLSNLAKNIHVSHIPTTRVHKDHHVNQIFGELNLAPQTRSMTRMVKEQDGLHQINDESFHTCIFACFLSQEEPKKVLQALKDPRWIEAMQKELLQFKLQKMDVKSDFLYETIEEEVYVCQPPGFEEPDYPDKVYVDDIIFGSTNKELCKAFEKLMKDKFQMSSMGELTFFLGLQVKQKDDGIFISQDNYVAKILKKFGFTDVKSASTPIETKKPLLKDPDGKDVDDHIYRSMIGSLMYLTSSRPDIMFVVCACARFQVTPKVSYLHAVFRYLKGKPHLGLWYPRDSPFNLVAYSDNDYARASRDRKSTTKGCQFLGYRLISWQFKKQTVVATSSTEAEYVAAVLKFYEFKISC
nr:hypothetical protein [Tanacetum cinerariifolium]